MKLTLDTTTNELKLGRKPWEKLDDNQQNMIAGLLSKFLINNTKLSDYEEDCMWMSYRYCIGRHTIASHQQASAIWKHCRGRMTDDRALFTAYDINREIEDKLRFGNPEFHFPLTNLNRIYTSAVDIVCEFIEEYNINSKEDFIKYKYIDIILTDNERGYKFEVTTWEEWLRPDMSQDATWKYFEAWKGGTIMTQTEMIDKFKEITRGMPNKDTYYMHDFEDLFVWNDLVHCFDKEHHHKSILVDGSECEWFWTWTEKSEQRNDGYFYKTFGYKKIRVPLDKWNGSVTTWIPDESIKEDIY